MTLVDCEAERRKYEALLRFEEEARLLLIEGGKGWGKTTLLNWARQESPFIEGRAAICLIDLDPNNLEASSPVEFNLVLKLKKELSQGPTAIPFTTFEPLDEGRRTRNWHRFATAIVASVNAEGADISGGVVAGWVQQVVQEMNVHGDAYFQLAPPEWTEELEDRARQLCIEAFLADLKEAADKRPVVILFDHWDKANSELRKWVLNGFVMPFALLPGRPERMLITMAVKDLHEIGYLGDRAMQTVERMGPLGQWSHEDVEQFVRHRYPDADDGIIGMVSEKIAKKEWSPVVAMQAIEYLQNLRVDNGG